MNEGETPVAQTGGTPVPLEKQVDELKSKRARLKDTLVAAVRQHGAAVQAAMNLKFFTQRRKGAENNPGEVVAGTATLGWMIEIPLGSNPFFCHLIFSPGGASGVGTGGGWFRLTWFNANSFHGSPFAKQQGAASVGFYGLLV